MLQKLYISNYAIIDELEVLFASGFNTITGETGAGKSILLGALSLILGERADTSVLKHKEQKCIIEGTFDITHNTIAQEWLKAEELDHGHELLLRREISANGKSRAFVNDTPVNLTQLQAISNLQVDLHRQFDTLSIGEADFQTKVLDALAQHPELLQQYRQQFRQWQNQQSQLVQLKTEQAQQQKEQDFNQFLFNELEEAALQPNEIEDLDIEFKSMSHAEVLQEAISKTSWMLQEGEQPVTQLLRSNSQQLQQMAAFLPALQPLAERLQSAYVELKDVATELDSLQSTIEFNAERQTWLNDRINLGNKLLKKHNVLATAELLQIREQLEEQLQNTVQLEEQIEKLEKEVQLSLDKTITLAAQITLNRTAQIGDLEHKTKTLLHQVGMPNATLQVRLTPKALAADGADLVEFLFDANAIGNFQPLRKVASGGELSRLMLCVKTLVAKAIELPTLIFDEIDTGISGEAAKQVGIILKALAEYHQIICITHQPQIAGKANYHLFVYKGQDNTGKINTKIRVLTTEERIRAVAQMLSGENPTVAALENAKELILN